MAYQDIFAIAKLFFKNISRTSLYLATAILILSFLTITQKNYLRRTIFFAIKIPFIFFIINLQRITTLTSLLICLSIIILRQTKNIIPLLSLALIVSLIVVSTNNRAKQLLNTPLNHATVNHRYNLWIASLNMFKEKPFLGHGYKSFKKKYKLYLDRNNPYFRKDILNSGYQDAHNLNLNLLAETGLLGFSCINFLFFYIFYLGFFKHKKNDNIFLLATLILMIYLNMQFHVHLDVNSIRALLFLLFGLFKSNLLAEKANEH
jgi:O-antigen ligase